MNLILLPGNTDQVWIKEVEKNIFSFFDNLYLIEYAHHAKGKYLIDLNYELNALSKLIQTEKIDDYVIFAKSAGTLLTIKGIHEGVLNPQKCIFLGVPINWAYHYKFNIDAWIQNYSIPTLFIQQTNDLYYSFKELKSYLNGFSVKNSQIFEVAGSDHHYSNIEEMKKLVKNYL
ncbi:hypothetical protein HZC27_03325 [Candidatus Roizmanbacteria bacterium]|nr:hypothetical protein [Candidatus Roizmanbacteria bacterium]